MITYVKEKDIWQFSKDGSHFSLNAREIGEMETLIKEIREAGSTKCKHCSHDELCHVGHGCYGSFFGEDTDKIDGESLFYGECLCRNFEPVEDNP